MANYEMQLKWVNRLAINSFNPIALRKASTLWSFDHSGYNRVEMLVSLRGFHLSSRLDVKMMMISCMANFTANVQNFRNNLNSNVPNSLCRVQP